MNRRQFLQNGWRQFGKILSELPGPDSTLPKFHADLHEIKALPPSCFPPPREDEENNNL